MNKYLIDQFSLYMLLTTANLAAQVSANGIMPAEVDLRAIGWRTTLQNGNLTFGMPISTVPGEVPIPVTFGFDATCQARLWGHPEYDGERRATRVVRCRMDWPIAAGIHFGYLADNIYGDAPVSSMPGAPSGRGMVVLETGKQIPDPRWTAIAADPALGAALKLPEAFGFAPVAPQGARVDSTATYLLTTTTEAGLGAQFRSLMPALAPSGFGGQGEHQGSFRMVLDERLARVYCYAADAGAWLPLIWVDRSGHRITFKWERSTTGIPPGFRSITKVTALNQRSQGVVVRWADPASSASLSDLCQVDFVGVRAPSALIQGYGGSPSRGPAGFSLQAHDHLFVVSQTNLGLVCRPTTLSIGSCDTLPQPGWADSGSSPAATPTVDPEAAPPGASSRTWRFSYDDNEAEVNSLTDPMGVVTSFHYSTYYSATTNYVRGVSEVHAVDADSNHRFMRWTRTFPEGFAPMSIKLENEWDPDPGPPDRFRRISIPTDDLNFGNGVPQHDVLTDGSGKTWSSTTIKWFSVGSGVDATLSRVQAVTIASEGAPIWTTTFAPDPLASGEGYGFLPGDSYRLATGGFWVYKIVCRGQVTMVTTNEAEAQSELERRREHGTESGGTGVRCEIVRTWVSGVGPMGNQGGSGGPSGQGAGQANQRIIRDLAAANDAGKYAADCAAINSYLTSIGKAVLWGAGTGAVTGGEIGATLGGLFGVGVGAVPLGGGGAAGGMVLGGFSGLVPTSVTGGVALRAQFEKNEVNWKANYRAVQNYSDTNCVGTKPEIRN